MAFRARKVFGSLEKRTPDLNFLKASPSLLLKQRMTASFIR